LPTSLIIDAERIKTRFDFFFIKIIKLDLEMYYWSVLKIIDP